MEKTWHNKTSHHCSELSLDRSWLHCQQPNTTQKIATDHKKRVDLWNLVTMCGMALRLEILIAGGFGFTPTWSCNALKGYSNILPSALETRPRSVQWVMVQDKPSRVLGSFVLDDSRTLFNQRPSDSRNGCRAREEPLKPSQEIFLSSTSFFLVETN